MYHVNILCMYVYYIICIMESDRQTGGRGGGGAGSGAGGRAGKGRFRDPRHQPQPFSHNRSAGVSRASRVPHLQHAAGRFPRHGAGAIAGARSADAEAGLGGVCLCVCV